ncbi:hypothetical protein ACFLYC_01065 [Chloroflexota bacterium]
MKASPEQLLEDIAPDFNTFLMSGNYINLSSFTRKIDPNLNINDVRKLLRIHFVLTTSSYDEIGVIDFVQKLNERVRRIKTTVRRETEEFVGQVKGRIRWDDTLSRRYNRNPKDKTLFVCDRGERDYEIAENLVLKRLLQIIHSIVYDDLAPAMNLEYDWLKQWTIGEGLRSTLSNVFYRNIYMRRIDLSDIRVTERMIHRAACSRLPLYRDAAYLLSKYHKLMNYDFDADEAKNLLRNTFIRPEATSVLFELYWVIKIIRQFDPKNVSFELIEPGSKMVAQWQHNGFRYVAYHNSTGSFQFREDTQSLSELLSEGDNYFSREIKVLKELENIVGSLQDLWGGRPDIIVERYNEDNRLDSVFIGEVKYTEDPSYAIQGLKELLEYMALIRFNGSYFEKHEDLFHSLKNVRGCLFVDNVPDVIDSQDRVQIVRYGGSDNIVI